MGSFWWNQASCFVVTQTVISELWVEAEFKVLIKYLQMNRQNSQKQLIFAGTSNTIEMFKLQIVALVALSKWKKIWQMVRTSKVL